MTQPEREHELPPVPENSIGRTWATEAVKAIGRHSAYFYSKAAGKELGAWLLHHGLGSGFVSGIRDIHAHLPAIYATALCVLWALHTDCRKRTRLSSVW